MDKPTIGRFWDKTVRFGGCLLWAGAKTSGGYGTFYANGKTHRAHRFAYEICKGEIPIGKQLDHLCRNRLCVNPEHLQAVTAQVNILRGVGASAQHALQTHCHLGHPLSGENLCTRLNGSRECRICRRKVRRRSTKKYELRYPEKLSAQNAVRYAVKMGKLIRQPCEICGDKAQAHHEDYSKKLEVTWLCPKHHSQSHHS